jgi:polynucleotide 5'-kinase involved in rRNA processing
MALSDRKLAELAEEHATLKARIRSLEERATKRQEAIIKELQRRGTKAIETADVRITVVQGETVRYDTDALRDTLSPAKFRLITTPTVDKTKLSRAVQAGKVDLDTVNECATVTLNKPYIRVSARDDG